MHLLQEGTGSLRGCILHGKLEIHLRQCNGQGFNGTQSGHKGGLVLPLFGRPRLGATVMGTCSSADCCCVSAELGSSSNSGINLSNSACVIGGSVKDGYCLAVALVLAVGLGILVEVLCIGIFPVDCSGVGISCGNGKGLGEGAGKGSGAVDISGSSEIA